MATTAAAAAVAIAAGQLLGRALFLFLYIGDASLQGIEESKKKKKKKPKGGLEPHHTRIWESESENDHR